MGSSAFTDHSSYCPTESSRILQEKAMRKDKQIAVGGASDNLRHQFTLLRRRARKQEQLQAFSEHLIRIHGPSRRNPEIPILCVLSRSPKLGLECRFVREELKRKYYPALRPEDLEARYKESGKKIVDSVVKFAKKHLVLRGEVYEVGRTCKRGIWRITPIGLERMLKEESTWVPKLSEYLGYVPTTEDDGVEEGNSEDIENRRGEGGSD
jgi:hypothetical protein